MPIRTPFPLSMAALLTTILIGGTLNAGPTFNTDAIATRHKVQTSSGLSIPAGMFGYMLVQRPREATLLRLRGIAGQGEVVLRTDQPGKCIRIPIRFVAGDFGGDTFSGHLAEPIVFFIKSRRVARALTRGKDVISDMYDVSAQKADGADIVLQTGLAPSFGFVINPGRNILGDLFGVRSRPVSCLRP